jgi:hypothetical protein
MAKEFLDIANIIYFFTISSSLEAWMCDQHVRLSLRSFRSYFTHPGIEQCFDLATNRWRYFRIYQSFWSKVILFHTANY